MNESITEKEYPIRGLWVIKSILTSGYLFILVVVVPLLFYRPNIRNKFEINASLILLIIFIISDSVIRIFLQRMTFHYAVEEKFLTLEQGIFSKQQRHIPYGVIQNIFVKQDPFDRVFGLASLTIENASQGSESFVLPQGKKENIEMVGFSGNKVNIPGLTKTNAEVLKEIVLRKMKENPIEDGQSGL